MERFVDVETPYMGKTKGEVKRNIIYTRACVRDCLIRGEIPFASHLFYTQPGILDDNIPEERNWGINAGKILIESLPNISTVVYQDLGISKGMQYGIERAQKVGRRVEYRSLGDGWEKKELEVALRHSHASVWGLE